MNDTKTPVFSCPEEQKVFSRVYKYADMATRLMEEHKTPPFPNTYALMYAYASAENDDIVGIVDNMLERGDLSAYEIDEVYSNHLCPMQDQAKREKIGERVEAQISSVLDLVGTGVENSDQFETVLQQIGNGIGQTTSIDQLSAAISNLMSENQRMAGQSRKLSDGLKESRKQIELLRRELEDVRNESMRDPLTSVHNRRAFDIKLAAELDAARQNNSGLCLAIADLDHFKRVNDTFGHRIGDEVLKVFANIISENIKGQDLVARYGGEEFAIILPATDLKAASILIDRIRLQTFQRKLVLKGSKKPLGDISASFGIAQFVPGMTPDNLVELADQRLYLAKRQGRNRVQAEDCETNAA
ncbi:hypothetical protein HY29_06845 [Hyphomonas beringensis]|uniref:diguanylate cyclase n=1 Tax=Hyphomonas beringensis TaxID=1280946 RepID=A0A062U4H4_9PROT|nr:GGDEF domain-containing protein [Hyphomonas beringensis]KCZ51065.1 hypothetical protein HY29_06845 [Hyphomonas beringensis]